MNSNIVTEFEGKILVNSKGGGLFLQFSGIDMEFTYQDSKIQILMYNLSSSRNMNLPNQSPKKQSTNN